MTFFFLNWRYFSEISKKKKKKSLLPKSTLKYQLYYQPLWVEIRCLQIQSISIWALVFYYCISDNFKKLQYNCNDIKKVSQNIFSNKIWTFLYKKSLSRNMFIVVVWLFFFSSMFFFCLLLRQSIFMWPESLLWRFFLDFKENTLQYLKEKIEVQIIIFSKILQRSVQK